MSPEGISVVEIRLNLPDTCYYLQWRPTAPLEHSAARRALLGRVRETARQLGWTVFAAGCGRDSARLLFRTAGDNLDAGMDAFADQARDVRLYMVQPDVALPLAARCVYESRAPAAAAGSDAALLPERHFGLFMGERTWAEQMLRILTCAGSSAPLPGAGASLIDIDARHSSRPDAIREAYRSGRFSLKDIAEHFEMHFSEISAVVNADPQDTRGDLHASE